MVQWGIFLIVVVMKRNRQIFVPSTRMVLRAFCCGECQEVQVRTGTSAQEYIMYMDTARKKCHGDGVWTGRKTKVRDGNGDDFCNGGGYGGKLLFPCHPLVYG